MEKLTFSCVLVQVPAPPPWLGSRRSEPTDSIPSSSMRAARPPARHPAASREARSPLRRRSSPGSRLPHDPRPRPLRLPCRVQRIPRSRRRDLPIRALRPCSLRQRRKPAQRMDPHRRRSGPRASRGRQLHPINPVGPTPRRSSGTSTCRRPRRGPRGGCPAALCAACPAWTRRFPDCGRWRRCRCVRIDAFFRG